MVRAGVGAAVAVTRAEDLADAARELARDGDSAVDSRLLARAHLGDGRVVVAARAVVEAVAAQRLRAAGAEARGSAARAVRLPHAGRCGAVGQARVLGAAAHAGAVPGAAAVDGCAAVLLAGGVLDANAGGVISAEARVTDGGQGRGREEESGVAHGG